MNGHAVQPRMRRRRKAKAVEYSAVRLVRMRRSVHKHERAFRQMMASIPALVRLWARTLDNLRTGADAWVSAIKQMQALNWRDDFGKALEQYGKGLE